MYLGCPKLCLYPHRYCPEQAVKPIEMAPFFDGAFDIQYGLKRGRALEELFNDQTKGEHHGSPIFL
jgi:hypothetical protein